MPKLLYLVFLFLLLCGCAAKRHPDQLTYPPLTFSVPQVEKIVLPNGIHLYLHEDHELPLVEITALIGGGSIEDPPDKTGLSDVLARTLRTGGAGARSGKQIDSDLERIAADYSVGADVYNLTFALSLQQQDLPLGLAILADTLRKPRVDESRFELAQRQKIETIRRQNDHPQNMALRLMMTAIYGDHPLGRSATAETVSAIKRQDLLDAIARSMVPNNLWLAISGDYQREELLQILVDQLGDWQGTRVPPALIALPEPGNRQRIQIVSKDLPQTVMVLGELGVEKNAPDLPAIRVMNFILGGGSFNSRLMRVVRTERGLAYSVYSYFQVGRRLPGPFLTQCETKNSTVYESLSLIRAEMKRIREEPASEHELRVARDSLINSFVFSFTTPHEVVAQALRLDFYGYPTDYLTSYRDRIAAVTTNDVLAAARRHLHPEQQHLVLIGKESEFDKDLAALDTAVKRANGEHQP